MDIAWWVRLSYKIDLSKYKQNYTNQAEYAQVTRNVKDIILKNIDTRISKLWVSDYESYLQKIGDDEFVIIEIGGVSNLEEAKATIGKTVELEFKTQYVGSGDDVKQERQLLAETILKESVKTPDAMQSIAATYESDQVFFARYDDTILEDLPAIYQQNKDVLTTKELWKPYPKLVEGVHSIIPIMSGVTDKETTIAGRVITKLISVWTTGSVASWSQVSGSVAATRTTYTLEEIIVTYTPSWISAIDPKTKEILNGAYFKFASVSQSQTGQPVATITFDDKGKEIFCNLTEQIVGQPMAIFVWWKMITSPVIREKICWGSAQIDGQFTPASANQLVRDLNEWALPAALILSNEEKVSPKLGDSALQWAMYAGIVWLVVVFVYMVMTYGVRQWVSSLITLLFFLSLLFAVVKIIGYALSLSGLAAILLSIGMGVDANILIYERIKEELQKGSRATQAIQTAYDRSWNAIRDGNLTTLMIGLLLLIVGTNIFKWFGTMMIVTILFTLFAMVPFIKELALYFIEDTKK